MICDDCYLFTEIVYEQDGRLICETCKDQVTTQTAVEEGLD
jgi:hypothetical protein